MKLIYLTLVLFLSVGSALATQKREAPRHPKVQAALKKFQAKHRQNQLAAPKYKSIKLPPQAHGSGPIDILKTFQYAFGSLTIGTTYDMTLGWFNPNALAIKFYHHTQTISGAPFSIVSDGCSNLELDFLQTCYFTIRFAPTATGSYLGTLTSPYERRSESSHEPVQHLVDYSKFAGAGRDPEAYDNDPPPLEQPEVACGSVINVDSQTVAESIPIVGTPFSLWYSSEFSHDFSSPYNTYKRDSRYNPEGFSVSVHHFLDIVQGRILRGDGSAQPVQYASRSGNIWVVSSDGSEIYVFNPSKHIETKTFLTGATKYLFDYDSNNKLIKITDAFGKETLFNRTGGKLSSIEAPNGQITTVTTNVSGLISEVENPASESHTMTYKSGTDLLETFTKPGGQVTTFSYDANGKLTQDLGNGGNLWDLAMTQTSGSRMVSQASKMGRETLIYNYQYENYGGSARWTTAATGVRTERIEYGGSGTFTYDDTSLDVNEESRVSDPRFITFYSPVGSRASYNFNDSTMDVTQYNRSVSGFVSDFNYTSLTTEISKNGKVTNEVFNKGTNTFTTTSPEGAISYRTLNSAEQTASTKIGTDTAWTYTYDGFGRLATIAQGLKNGVTNTYNSDGFLATVTNARSEQTSYTYDAAGRATQVTLPDLRVVGYSYDANGNLAGVTPPSRPEHIFGFNSYELMGTYEPPALTGLSVKDTTYTYNNDKQLTSVVRPDGQSIGYTYDATTGLLSSSNLTRGNNALQYHYRSEKVSRIDSADGIGSEFTYFLKNILSESQIRSSDDFQYAKIDYSFDSDHRRSSRTLQGNTSTIPSTITTTFNDDDMPTQVGSMALAYSYPSGRLSTTNLDRVSDSRTYDTYGQLESYTAVYTPVSGPVQTLYSYTFTRDVMGRISSKSETVLGVTTVYDYSFDTTGRLTTVLKDSAPYSSYTYDSNGNRTSGTHAGTAFVATYDDQDRMLTYNSRVYSYNANGDNTQIDWNTTETTHFSYDALGSLVGATLPDTTALLFKYDGSNRQVHVTAGGVTSARRIYENDFRIAAELNDTGVIAKEFVYQTSINSPDYMISGGVKYRYIKDHLGSPRLIVKSTDGTVTQRLDYTELGKITSDTSPGFQPFAFAGGILESSTHLVKFGARYYDADVGRWSSKDPILFKGGDTNLFGYVQSDPLNFTDASGTGPVAWAACMASLQTASAIAPTYAYEFVSALQNEISENSAAERGQCPIKSGGGPGTAGQEAARIAAAAAARAAVQKWGAVACNYLYYLPGY